MVLEEFSTIAAAAASLKNRSLFSGFDFNFSYITRSFKLHIPLLKIQR